MKIVQSASLLVPILRFFHRKSGFLHSGFLKRGVLSEGCSVSFGYEKEGT
jgi:hypothetical protein